jgi:signal peptidase I
MISQSEEMNQGSQGAGSSGSPTSKARWIIENIISLGLALLIVFMIRSSIVEAFKIPSGSMIPTLLTGDHIFVNKFAYGLKIPFSDIFSDHPTFVVKRDPPKRGDIIVFKYPKDERVYFIKRVIGTPGDTIEIKNKTLYINQQAVQRVPFEAKNTDKIYKSFDDPKYSPANLDLFTEHLDPANTSNDHLVMLDKQNVGDAFGPVTVPPEQLFVMGDNRDFSNDSRFWGFVPMNNVKGRAMVIWLSLWVNISNGQFIFRPERIGTVLH